MSMTRQELSQFCIDELNKVMKTFDVKGPAYATSDDGMANFRETAKRMLPEMYKEDEWSAMYRVLLVLIDKHYLALSKGMDVFEFAERLDDIIIYSLIAKAMHKCRTSEDTTIKGGATGEAVNIVIRDDSTGISMIMANSMIQNIRSNILKNGGN